MLLEVIYVGAKCTQLTPLPCSDTVALDPQVSDGMMKTSALQILYKQWGEMVI